MAVSPLIRQLSSSGGTLVAFSSASKDLGYIFDAGNTRFSFSHFALLRIPPIQRPTNGKNDIQFDAMEGHYTQRLSTASPVPAGDRADLGNSFQNYLLNLESTLLDDGGYDNSVVRSVSERAFWKWMKELGAIRYRTADTSEKASTVTDDRFVEEDFNDDAGSGNLYESVVKYIGEISIQTSRKTGGNGTSEIYMHVPSEAGDTPVVLFNAVSDANYSPSKIIKNPTAGERILGRSAADDPTPAGLSTLAVYDMDVVPGTYDYDLNAQSGEYWFQGQSSLGPNAYFTDTTFGDPTNDTQIRVDTLGGRDVVTVIRSRMDGAVIDFDRTNYNAFESNPTWVSFNDFNRSGASSNFDFNAVLLYYTVTEADGTETQNLFGVLFLNDLALVGASNSEVERLGKEKNVAVLGQNGNAYGFKLDLRFDVTLDNPSVVEVDVSVNDYNTFSLDLFSDAVGLIGKMAQELELTNDLVNTLIKDYSSLADFARLNPGYQELLIRIQELENGIKTPDNTSNDDILGLVNKNADNISGILSGDIDVDVTPNINIRGVGLTSVNQIGGDYVVDTRLQKIVTVAELDVTTGPLGGNEFTFASGMTIIHQSSVQLTATQDVYIYLDDREHTYSVGDFFEVIYDSSLVFNGQSIIVLLDKLGRLGFSPYGATFSLSPTDFPRGFTAIVANINPLTLIFK